VSSVRYESGVLRIICMNSGFKEPIDILELHSHLESFEMWCWKRMEKICWTDHVRNEDVLLRVKEQRNILHEICKRKANWIGHILRRNCLLQRVTEGKIQGGIEVTERQGRRRRSYWMTSRKGECTLI